MHSTSPKAGKSNLNPWQKYSKMDDKTADVYRPVEPKVESKTLQTKNLQALVKQPDQTVIADIVEKTGINGNTRQDLINISEDVPIQEKHDKLNDIFPLERPNDEVYELEFDAKEGVSGVGYQMIHPPAFRKLIGGLYQR